MIKIYDINSSADFLEKLKCRAERVPDEIMQRVAGIIEDVKTRGDEALFEYAEKFDKVKLDSLEMSSDEFEKAISKVDSRLYEAMERSAENIKRYHERQKRQSMVSFEGGITVGQRIIPLDRAGLYVPGGTAAYPSSVLMNAIPAKVAGVGELCIVTPPKAEGVNPAVMAAAKIAGVDRIFKVGGAQAIAALAYGTETIKRADVIAGPGNIYVAMAKKLVYGDVSIDMIAGPSEILVIADSTADPDYIAADLLSQAEHDFLASSVLVTDSMPLAQAVAKSLEIQLPRLKRSDIARGAIENYGGIIVAENLSQAVSLSNEIAPEHLEIMTASPMELLGDIKNAGSVFLGKYTPEPVGDYYAGPNHVLPTNRSSRFSSPLSVDCFIKKSSFVQYSADALFAAAEDIVTFAESEGLGAHAQSVRIRVEKEHRK